MLTAATTKIHLTKLKTYTVFQKEPNVLLSIPVFLRVQCSSYVTKKR